VTVIPGGGVGIGRVLEAVEGGTERTEVAPSLGVAELFECRLQLDSRGRIRRRRVRCGDASGIGWGRLW
jgi:hypothetical protein